MYIPPFDLRSSQAFAFGLVAAPTLYNYETSSDEEDYSESESEEELSYYSDEGDSEFNQLTDYQKRLVGSYGRDGNVFRQHEIEEVRKLVDRLGWQRNTEYICQGPVLPFSSNMFSMLIVKYDRYNKVISSTTRLVRRDPVNGGYDISD